MTQRCAVIQFPGSNCEYETAKAVADTGSTVDIIRWNVTESEFLSFDSYVIPGGFSFQDRVRAGVISAKLPIISYLKKANDDGRPILGICNGCQILSEAGLVMNVSKSYDLDVALAPNERDGKLNGFMCDWVFVRPNNPSHSVFLSRFSESDVLPIPINHGEGRFVLSKSATETFSTVSSLVYCSHEGQVDASFPVNPNGSTKNIAGISNTEGNVFAMMPHPERASFVRQIPTSIQSSWVKKKEAAFSQRQSLPGPWAQLFLSMTDYVARKTKKYAAI
jgi:phosphoribosylformylglycinamidine synthase I